MSLDELINSGFLNLEEIERAYTTYQISPEKVDESWKRLFSEFETTYRHSSSQKEQPLAVIDYDAAPDLRVYNLIQAYRTYGHLFAKNNPIAVHAQEEPHQLHLESLGFKSTDLQRSFPTNGLLQESTAPLTAIIDALKETYCNTIGIEYMGLQNPEMEQWVQQQIEPNRFKTNLSIEEKRLILQHLNKSELFEVFLHTKYVGQKRFSLEGGETLIPILADIIETGAKHGIKECVIGMAHRGRLNVLTNIMEKSYSQIFSEFEEGYVPLSFEGSGDVKYHKGFSAKVPTSSGHDVHLLLTPNPSHLEAVNPVVQGQARAKQDRRGGRSAANQTVPILIHGDAALAGQGIVYETLQLYDLEGYSTGGTIHVVINNQIGFTTLPRDSRSTHYCTDIARTFNAPVFHVNAEDPESCIYATNLAVALRQKFQCDVFIDLICYRKYGHNEADEPAFTQPLEYQIIRKKRPIREIYRDDLIQQGVLEREMAEQLETEFKSSLQEALTGTRYPKKDLKEKEATPSKPKKESVVTAVPHDELRKTALAMCQVPESFTLNKKLERLITDRLAMAEGKKAIDWGMGEMLAYATLLSENIPIRISGQDCCRGTFSHRHAMWVDQEKEQAYFPLKSLKEGQAPLYLYNSPLSEYAVLGFEYGYSITNPETLVIWEAQFGDFCNGAQVMIDQFIATGEMKWGQTCGVSLLLPHGYEGQGPEHSSGRIERFLNLCGNDNMLVANVTLPSQLFHLLRHHAKRTHKKPLILFTPKGLLRHPECVSDFSAFTEGEFSPIIDDTLDPKGITELVFCSGKVYYDLIHEREERKRHTMAIVRIEQLYPFEEEQVATTLKKYSNVTRYVWAQEEPKNMGAWGHVRSQLRRLIGKEHAPEYVGRDRSASPAAGSFTLHQREHAKLLSTLFDENLKEAKAHES